MSNSYFQFKQFRVEQVRSAMKVTTDACIHGAWTPILPGVKTVLDIGTGSGLLSLMLAQRSITANIDALEIDKDAAMQAGENAAASPWHNRIKVSYADIREWDNATAYDLIISNPPFFTNGLLNNDEQKTAARHTVSLTHSDLVKVIAVLLSESGYASVLLPITAYPRFQELFTAEGLHETGKLLIRHRAKDEPNRIVAIISRNQKIVIGDDQLVIKDDDDHYSASFIRLLSPFYLNL